MQALPYTQSDTLPLLFSHPPTHPRHLQHPLLLVDMPPKRRTRVADSTTVAAANGRAAQNKQGHPPKRPALSLLDTDTDGKKPPAPKRPVKRARKSQTQPLRTRSSSHGHGQEDDDADDDDDGGDADIPERQVANINRYVSTSSRYH